MFIKYVYDHNNDVWIIKVGDDSYYLIGVRDITGIPVYHDLGVPRFVSRYAFTVPVHSAISVSFRNMV